MSALEHASNKEAIQIAQQIRALSVQIFSLTDKATANGAERPESDSLDTLRQAAEMLTRAEEKIRQQNEDLDDARQAVEAHKLRYHDLFDAASDGYVTTDLNGVIREANRAASQLLGVALEHLIGKPLVVYISVQDRARFRTELSRLQTDALPVDVECRIQPRKADMFDCLLSGNSVISSRARLIRWTLRDITQQKLAHEILRQSRTELERQVSARTQELSTTNRKLQEEIAERRRAQLAEHEQRIIADALRDTTLSLTSTLQLPDVLDQVLLNLRKVAHHDAAAVLLEQGDTLRMARSQSYGVDGTAQKAKFQQIKPLPAAESRQLLELTSSLTPIILAPSKHSPHPVTSLFPSGSAFRSLIGIPLIDQGEAMGMLLLVAKRVNAFTPYHAEILQGFAAAAVVAIKNAGAHSQAGQIARLEERQRLARELHDAVSQTLFTASLIADTLPFLWTTDTEEAGRQMVQLQTLNRGALAEMRTLLLELRPEQMVKAEIGESLTRLVSSLRARKRADVELLINHKSKLSSEVQFTFYRIAQEALNNIIKHSLATKIKVEFTSGAWGAELRVEDNGVGFAPEATKTGLGMETMRERAKTIGASFELHSEPQQGTRIAVRWIVKP